jgi:pimeloyl-ACP methyl ester carboxylesterase
MDVQISGEGSATIVALHGIQGTRAAWRPVADRLAGQARFVLPNLRGRAAAMRGTDASDYGLEAYAADVAEVLARHVGGERFYLAGWSMGVSVALETLRLSPATRPAGLILLSGTPCLAQAAWFRREGDALLAEVAARERRLGLAQAADHDAVAHTWTAISRTDQRGILRGIDVPTLVLQGRNDEDSPWLHATWLAEGLPQARLVTLEGAGHSLLTQASARVAGEISHFIARIERDTEIRMSRTAAPKANSAMRSTENVQ